MRTISYTFFLSLTLCVWYILGLNQTIADGFPIVDKKSVGLLCVTNVTDKLDNVAGCRSPGQSGSEFVDLSLG
jgi:hypothetical protein